MPHYNILIACNQLDYDEWAVNCLESIQKHAPWISLYCHIVNPQDHYEIPGVNYTTEEKDFVSEMHETVYLECVRFIIIPRIFSSTDLILAIDPDFVCVKDFFEEDFEIIAKNITILQHPKSGRWLKSFVTFGHNNFAKDFVKELYEDDEEFWPYNNADNLLEKLSSNYKYKPVLNNWINIKKASGDPIFLKLKDDIKSDKKFKDVYKSYINRLENTDRVYHLHHEDRENLYDITNPFKYFSSNIGTEYILINNIKKKLDPTDHGSHIVISGNVTLDSEKILGKLEEWTSYEYKSLSIWNGRLHNFIDNPTEYYTRLNDVKLLSFTENFSSNTWVPCVSCMNKIFDKTYEKKNNGLTAILDGKRKNKYNIKAPTVLDTDNLKIICHLIGVSETIITNSFYGAYWAMLLNKKVLVTDDVDPRVHYIPLPYIRTSNRYFSNIKTFSANPEFLNICRRRNIEFYEKLKLQVNSLDE
jgi:hypothetical protein